MAEAVLALQRPAGEAAMPLFSIATLNRKHDNLGEGRRLLKVDLINPDCYPRRPRACDVCTRHWWQCCR